jgi:hypothetical protein
MKGVCMGLEHESNSIAGSQKIEAKPLTRDEFLDIAANASSQTIRLRFLQGALLTDLRQRYPGYASPASNQLVTPATNQQNDEALAPLGNPRYPLLDTRKELKRLAELAASENPHEGESREYFRIVDSRASKVGMEQWQNALHRVQNHEPKMLEALDSLLVVRTGIVLSAAREGLVHQMLKRMASLSQDSIRSVLAIKELGPVIDRDLLLMLQMTPASRAAAELYGITQVVDLHICPEVKRFIFAFFPQE